MNEAVQSARKQIWNLSSPDGRLQVNVMLDDQESLFYYVEKNGAELVAVSPLGIGTDRMAFTEGLQFVSIATTEINESYTMPHGKMKHCINQANELTLHFSKNAHTLQVFFRAYDDAIAFRYQMPEEGFIQILSEPTGFALPQDRLINVWAQKFMECYERTYDHSMLELMEEDGYAMPMLFQIGNDGWMLLSEAGVYGSYCASHVKVSKKQPRMLELAFAPDQEGPNVTEGSFATPWRVAIIGDELSTIVESMAIFHLNPPSVIEDMSWIRPGRSAWSWYSDSASCRDQEKQFRFIDFAADMGWEYSLVDGGWDREDSTVNVPELIQYAETKGVGIWLWSHFKGLKEEANCRSKMALWSGWGVKGVKVDFFDSDSQERIQVYDMIAEVALEHKLMINYHGATKPSGEQRRWPHVMTREGIFGAEYWKNPLNEGPNAVHNCTVPFTRNVVGSMDYTPVTFTNLTRTGHCHQLALAVLFESAVQNFADSIEAYEDSAGKPFLQQVPATWDQTWLLEGFPGRYVTMARRSGSDWFVGAICAASGRSARVNLEFLEEGVSYTAEIYEEVFDKLDHYRFKHSTEISVRHETVTKKDSLLLKLRVNGGSVIRIVKAYS
jgi:alpha-glucosidase